ncbi:MAG TPA: hypothetical protein VN494_02050 [Patescibacteria group bacterium]|nr:hypothetical protein [Patescibacteria group bacterium]
MRSLSAAVKRRLAALGYPPHYPEAIIEHGPGRDFWLCHCVPA